MTRTTRIRGSPGRFALPPSDAPCEAGRANRPGEPQRQESIFRDFRGQKEVEIKDKDAKTLRLNDATEEKDNL